MGKTAECRPCAARPYTLTIQIFFISTSSAKFVLPLTVTSHLAKIILAQAPQFGKFAWLFCPGAFSGSGWLVDTSAIWLIFQMHAD